MSDLQDDCAEFTEICEKQTTIAAKLTSEMMQGAQEPDPFKEEIKLQIAVLQILLEAACIGEEV